MRLFLAMICMLVFVGCRESAAYHLRHCIDGCNVKLRQDVLDKQTIQQCYDTCKEIAKLPTEPE